MRALISRRSASITGDCAYGCTHTQTPLCGPFIKQLTRVLFQLYRPGSRYHLRQLLCFPARLCPASRRSREPIHLPITPPHHYLHLVHPLLSVMPRHKQPPNASLLFFFSLCLSPLFTYLPDLPSVSPSSFFS